METYVAQPTAVGVAFVGVPLDLPLFGADQHDRMLARLIGTNSPFKARAMVTLQRPDAAYSVVLSRRPESGLDPSLRVDSSWPSMYVSTSERDAGAAWVHEYDAGVSVPEPDDFSGPLMDADRLLRGVAPHWELDAARLSLEYARENSPFQSPVRFDDGMYGISLIGGADRLRVTRAEVSELTGRREAVTILAWDNDRAEYDAEYVELRDEYGSLLSRHTLDDMPRGMSSNVEGTCDMARYYRTSLLMHDLALATSQQEISRFEMSLGDRRREVLRDLRELEQERERDDDRDI